MRKFNAEQTATVIELQQMVVDYWREVDFNAGREATDFFTKDCKADFGAIQFEGHDGVRQYYADRSAAISRDQKDGIRTTRHVFHNLQISLEGPDRAKLTFVIATYAGEGAPPVSATMKPVSISDTCFECRRDEQGQWLIAGFNGAPIFIGDEAFARNALTGSMG